MQASSSRSFEASYDLVTKVVSTLVCAAPLGIALFAHSWLVGGVILLCILLVYGWSPRGYEIEGRTVRIRRLIGSVQLTLHAVGEVRKATRDDLRGAVKLMGSGGLFGYYGIYCTSALGKCTWYLTSRKNAVVLRTGGKTYLLSPDDTGEFVALVQAGFDLGIAERAAAVAAEGATGEGAAPAQWREARADDDSSKALVVLAGCLIGFAVIALVVAAVMYAPGPPQYTLTPQSLTIHDRFYGVTLNASEVDTSKLRIVDLSWESDWRPVTRTNGFANGHYRAGWFRLANGLKVRLYRANSMQLVLLPAKGDGTTVLMEAADPNECLRQIREAWVR